MLMPKQKTCASCGTEGLLGTGFHDDHYNVYIRNGSDAASNCAVYSGLSQARYQIPNQCISELMAGRLYLRRVLQINY